MTPRRTLTATVSVLALTLLPVLPAVAAPAASPSPDPAPVSDTVTGLPKADYPFQGTGKTVRELVENPQPQRRAARSLAPAAVPATPEVGTVRKWLANDDLNGAYLKDFTLRGVGDKIEVWVANDTAFPEGDCRAAIPGSTDVTDAQVAELISEFDTNMYPTETAAFSTPPDRDGTHATLAGYDFTGDGDKTVALIDNVRDDNFYTFPEAPTYIAGFFWSYFNELADRNIMTIDAFDWAHRSGADPADEPTDDLCTSRPARPHLYEGTFAHEWQHLLEYYQDPFEGNWVNEGLSDVAQTLVGYVDATLGVDQRGFDSHITCFQGWGTVQTAFNTNPRDCGGPENSLNLWDEGNPNAVLADYGHAYAFLLYLYDRFGTEFLSDLHRDGELQGIASVQAALDDVGGGDVYDLLHDFQSTLVLDKLLEGDGASVTGTSLDRVTTASLSSALNLANPALNVTPGVAPNSADYVPLASDGRTLKANQIKSLQFTGAQTLPAVPLEWTVVSDDPDSVGDPVLWSGNGNSIDASAVVPVTVPTADPTLRFDAKYGAEAGYDYGYVSVSTDGGATYTPIAGDKTVAGPFGPALNGTTDGFEPHVFDLSAYAGQSILLSFRYNSDGGVNEGGLKVDDITVGGTLVSDGSSLDAFDSPTEIHPVPVDTWHLKLIGLDAKKQQAAVVDLGNVSEVSLGKKELKALGNSPTVVAVVAYDDPTELVTQYAPYALTVNGTLQPGGAE